MTTAERCTFAGCRRKVTPGCFVQYHLPDGPLSEPHAVCQSHYDASMKKCPPRQPGSFWGYFTGCMTASNSYTVYFPTIQGGPEK